MSLYQILGGLAIIYSSIYLFHFLPFSFWDSKYLEIVGLIAPSVPEALGCCFFPAFVLSSL